MKEWQELQINPLNRTVTVSVGSEPVMVLIDPKQSKANLVRLVEHGDVVVKCYQGKITGYDERRSVRL
ncbi:XtrA/YqaO family protein [Brevibacillus massiliensis]|uniref:XtrA/YqaO family protein n=1 Tax=Brevibacillus massiliensis TaxID=1118054 RepID=UPI0002DE0260|nr:XtrA/YqaO family protein [Brevibacillus massiliensis]